MDSFGASIRVIRKSKNMNLSELANGIVSTAFLSKFETGKNDMNVSNFFLLLDRLNISYKEFRKFRVTNEFYSRSDYSKKFNQAVAIGNRFLLNSLLDSEKVEFQRDKNIRHIHNIIVIQQYINRISNLQYNSKQIKIVSDYLESIEDWGLYEVRLLNMSIIFFNSLMSEKLCRKALQNTSMYINSTEIKHELSAILANTVLSKLEINDLKNIPIFINLAHQTLSGSKLYYEINKINFLEGLYHVKRGNQEKGLALANNALMIMKNLKDFESAQRHEEILQQYLKE